MNTSVTNCTNFYARDLTNDPLRINSAPKFVMYTFLLFGVTLDIDHGYQFIDHLAWFNIDPLSSQKLEVVMLENIDVISTSILFLRLKLVISTLKYFIYLFSGVIYQGTSTNFRHRKKRNSS